MVSLFVRLIRSLLGLWFALSITLVIVYKFVPVKCTPLMLIRKAEARKEHRTLDIRQTWVPLENISTQLIQAVINAEDAGFFEHKGFVPDAIHSAYLHNKYWEEIVAGGSSISQQTAKNVFCTPHRTWLRKAVEAYYTVLIELFWGKERILEVYLNVIEMGDGLFGVEEGARFECDKSVQYLDMNNAEHLASIIPNPRFYGSSDYYRYR